MGGSDMIEPAALGKPTCFGSHTFNFPQADDLVSHGCRRVPDIASLQEALCSWLADPALAKQAGLEAQDFVLSQQGATQRNVAMLCELLHRQPAFCEGGIATDCEILQNG
jgi:3-deoxy-D-manno-octulosonic-acid transferase